LLQVSQRVQRFQLREVSTSLVSPRLKSTEQWMKRHTKDKYVLKSKQEQYRARSAYKLLEIQERFDLLSEMDVVVECGGAPGAWTQVLTQIIGGKGKVVSCDLLDIEPVAGAVTLSQTDFTLPQCQESILAHVEGRGLNAVLSDMSPNLSGNKQLDQDQMHHLVYSVIKFSLLHTKQDGTLLMKLFFNQNSNRISEDLKRFYRRVEFVKPGSSRKESAELYLLARNFVGIKQS